jgi:hypothetical protein
MLLILPFVASCATPNKAELDDEVRRLCAVDGGVKVYETVTLPAHRFDKAGNVKVPMRTDAKPSDEYYLDWQIYYYRRGNPELSRDHFKIVRRSDGKVMGEAIYYGRGGGDIPGPRHDTSFRCPDTTAQPSLESSVFLQEKRR